jgi:hypothetical protein
VTQAPEQKPLLIATDHGQPVVISPRLFAPKQERGGWGPAADTFLRMNEKALATLDVRPEIAARPSGPEVQVVPGGSAGAIPLRASHTGHVVGGLVVRPRFGWSGVGRVLMETGWHAAPEFADLPLVPGSGREVPPWVLAGPVLARLGELLRHLHRGYRVVEATRTRPRGRILWQEYTSHSFARGAWHVLPCRFPDLSNDVYLRRIIRWSLERVRQELVTAGGMDPVANLLAAMARRLIDTLLDVSPLMPKRNELQRLLGPRSFLETAVRQGIEAMAWIVEERGLGGGREQDGLAWSLPLSRLWERYVEAMLRREAALVGADLRTARNGQTTFPLYWNRTGLRSMGHLSPDFVIRRAKSIEVVDAKYKSHFAELDETRWNELVDEARQAHRADVHQILAYASLFDADDITATLIYPLRHATWKALRDRGRDSAQADLTHGGRSVRVRLRGLPFGAGARGDETFT